MGRFGVVWCSGWVGVVWWVVASGGWVVLLVCIGCCSGMVKASVDDMCDRLVTKHANWSRNQVVD